MTTEIVVGKCAKHSNPILNKLLPAAISSSSNQAVATLAASSQNCERSVGCCETNDLQERVQFLSHKDMTPAGGPFFKYLANCWALLARAACNLAYRTHWGR